MSSAIESDTPLREPKTILWLHTFEIDLPRDVISIVPGKFTRYGPYEVPLLPDKFYFQLSKLSADDILASCIRVPSNPAPDSGYVLRFSFSVAGIDEAPKSVDMSFNEKYASVRYKTTSFALKMEREGYQSYVWNFKIVIRMIEYNSLKNAKYEIYEELLTRTKLEIRITERQLEDMAYLLKRPGLTDLFSGRQNDSFAEMKLACILNAVSFSEVLAQYFNARERGDEKLPILDFGSMLNNIFLKRKEPISNANAIALCVIGHRFGLNFLQEIVREHFITKLNNLDFLIDIIKVAYRVDDRLLFNKASDVFVANMDQILNSDKWKQLVNRSLITASFIIYDIKFRLTSQELHLPHTPEEAEE